MSEEIKRKEGLDRKNKNLKKTIKCALTYTSSRVAITFHGKDCASANETDASIGVAPEAPPLVVLLGPAT